MNPGDILEPVDFVRYDPETGQILEVGNMAVGSVIRLGSEFGWSYIIGRARLGEDYVDVDRLDPVIAPRGPCPAAISGVVLSGLPIPCTVEVEDEAGDVSRAECSEPSLALDFDYPGAYVVTVRSVPYLDGTFTVEV